MPSKTVQTLKTLEVKQTLSGIKLGDFRLNMGAQGIFKEALISIFYHVYPEDITFDWAKSSLATAGAVAETGRRQQRGRRLGEGDSSRGLAVDSAVIAYTLVYVLEVSSNSQRPSPYNVLLTAGTASTFTQTLKNLATQGGITQMESVTAAALTTADLTVKTVTFKATSVAPSSRPSGRPGPPASPPTMSGNELIGLALGVTIGGLALLIGCFFFGYTEFFREAKKSAVVKVRDALAPKPRQKLPKRRGADYDEEEEEKFDPVDLRSFDLEMADLYRSRDTAFSHSNSLSAQKIMTKRLEAASSAGMRTPATTAAAAAAASVAPAASSRAIKTQMMDSRFKALARVPARLDDLERDLGDVPLWEKKWSDAHKQWYWRHRFDGKVSWTNPDASPAHTRAAAVSSPPGRAASVTSASDGESVLSDRRGSPRGGAAADSRAAKEGNLRSASRSGGREHQAPQSSPPAAAATAHAWEEKFSLKHHLPYWRNVETGAVSWSLPAELAALQRGHRGGAGLGVGGGRGAAAAALTIRARPLGGAGGGVGVGAGGPLLLTRDALRAQNARDEAQRLDRGSSVASSGLGAGSVTSAEKKERRRQREREGDSHSVGSHGSRRSGASNAESIHSRGSARSSQRMGSRPASVVAAAATVAAAEAEAAAD